ncbi:hypothetical protein A8M77_20895 [Variovorax sp. JS1663]|nr:hypothetical protein A8M77_20895 [Variovorax sp. JS1663]
MIDAACDSDAYETVKAANQQKYPNLPGIGASAGEVFRHEYQAALAAAPQAPSGQQAEPSDGRADFERAMRTAGWSVGKINPDSGEYQSPAAQCGWAMWQAALAGQQSERPEPAEPTQEQKNEWYACGYRAAHREFAGAPAGQAVDEARYRWVRMNRLWLKANLPMLSAAEFDAAVDAALAASQAERPAPAADIDATEAIKRAWEGGKAVGLALSRPAPADKLQRFYDWYSDRYGYIPRRHDITKEPTQERVIDYWETWQAGYAYGYRAAHREFAGAPAGRAVERTPKDYAIEHAEYMATRAVQLVAAVNDLALAEQEHEDGTANESDVQAARDSVDEALRAVTSSVYEFRKRRDRALASQAERPAEEK